MRTSGAMTRSFRFALVLALPLAACSSNESGNDTADASVASDAASDAAPGTATLSGNVSRTAAPSNTGDARGHIYVALFDRDPVINQSSAVVVAMQRLDNADLSASGTTLPYTLTGIPPRAMDYFLLAFLDDNNNVDPAAGGAGPDKGDLVSLDGFASPKVEVSAAGTVTENIILNSVLPF